MEKFTNDWCCFIGDLVLGYLCIRVIWSFVFALYEHFAGAFRLKHRLLKYGEWAGEWFPTMYLHDANDNFNC